MRTHATCFLALLSISLSSICESKISVLKPQRCNNNISFSDHILWRFGIEHICTSDRTQLTRASRRDLMRGVGFTLRTWTRQDRTVTTLFATARSQKPAGMHRYPLGPSQWKARESLHGWFVDPLTSTTLECHLARLPARVWLRETKCHHRYTM